MALINSYGAPGRALVDGDVLLGWVDGTRAVPLSAILAFVAAKLDPVSGDELAANVATRIAAVLAGTVDVTMTDEMSGAAVTGRLRLSGGVLKLA